MTRTARLLLLLSGLVCAAALRELAPAGFGAPPAAAQSKSPAVTFNKDVAPILFKQCVVCHHPGGPGPFSLLTYSDAKRRAQQIATVTRSRYMPPWLPEPGYGEFVGNRRLSDEKINLFARWAEEGAAEGLPSDLPPAPRFNEGWQLGTPDLIVKMPRPFTLRAGGSDVFRNFVLPIPVTKTRYVRALEMLPGNKRIVHHANILIDRSGTSRRLDGKEPEPGFGGMEIKIESERFEPQTHFLFWKPGTVASFEPEGMAWVLDKNTDLVLNMHLQPSGKPEMIQPAVGIYFIDQPPARFPMLLQLEHDGALDIPPGEKNFVVTDELKLPLDVEVLGIYPHAHYLGKDIQGYATLPDGSKQWLIWIKDWDLNWQAVFEYAKPVFLPKGSTLHMRWTYDNSADNVRNPNHPPRRVVTGNRSSDEMSHLWIQVLPKNREDLKLLQMALMQRRLEKYPNDFEALFNLGAALQSMGKQEEAISYLREAIRVRPEDGTAHNNLGAALQAVGKIDEAAGEFRQALKARPDYADAHFNLGTLLLSRGQMDEAAEQFRAVLRARPDDADSYNYLGTTFAMEGDLAAAAAEFERAVRIKPEHAGAHYNLATLLARQGYLARASAEFEAAVRLDPENADLHNDYGGVLAMQGKLAQAAAEFETALRLNPNHSQARENLRRASGRPPKSQ
jgi:Tfp pilus assembly protein PilF/mono/diheme cytochrome c family protein